MRIDANKFSHLQNQEQTYGKDVGYCACGKSPENCSLGVKRDGNTLLYNCFSNNCPVDGGRLTINVEIDDVVETRVIERRKVEFNQTRNTFPETEDAYLHQFGIGKRTRHRYKIKYDDKWGRIVFPVFNTEGDVVAYTARSLNNNIKWLHDRSLNGVCYLSRTSASLSVHGRKIGILLEDPISTVVAGQITPAIALLGTQYKSKLDAIKEWKRFNKIDCVYVCLDLDAWAKGVELALWLNRNGIKAVPKRIDRDIKWFSEKELVELIKGE